MSADAILTLKEEILELADVFAEAVVKKMHPAKDELTRRQARAEFDPKWLKRQEDQGYIKGRRRGVYKTSPIIYSRAELMALKEAERRGARMVRRQNN